MRRKTRNQMRKEQTILELMSIVIPIFCLAVIGIIMAISGEIYRKGYDEGFKAGADHMEIAICTELGASDWEECQGYIEAVAP